MQRYLKQRPILLEDIFKWLWGVKEKPRHRVWELTLNFTFFMKTLSVSICSEVKYYP